MQRHKIAHDYVIANYVCASGKYYPLEFRRFRKRQEGDTSASFKSHTKLFKELVDWVVAQDIPGDFAFDSYFSSAESLNHIQDRQRGYVGALKSNRKVEFKGRVDDGDGDGGGDPVRGPQTGLYGQAQTMVFHRRPCLCQKSTTRYVC